MQPLTDAVRARLPGRVEQGHEPRSLRSFCLKSAELGSPSGLPWRDLLEDAFERVLFLRRVLTETRGGIGAGFQGKSNSRISDGPLLVISRLNSSVTAAPSPSLRAR